MSLLTYMFNILFKLYTKVKNRNKSFIKLQLKLKKKFFITKKFVNCLYHVKYVDRFIQTSKDFKHIE